MTYTPQARLLGGQSVRILKHQTEVGGEFARVRDIFWREDEPWVLLQLPLGSQIAVPAEWTDLAPEHLCAARDQAEIHPLALLELARFCRRVLQRRRRSGSRTRGRGTRK